LLAHAPDPTRAAALSKSKIAAALTRAHRRDVALKAERIQGVLRAQQLAASPVLERAYATVVASQVRLISALVADIGDLQVVVGEGFGRHREAEVYRSLPGIGPVLGARLLAEFGDDPHRYADAKARKNYAGTSPITRASGKKNIVIARYARNRRLGDAVHQWAFCALKGSPGARAYYDALRAATSATTPPYARSVTAWSGSCTAASKPAPCTTRPPPGRTT
jgi:transposase